MRSTNARYLLIYLLGRDVTKNFIMNDTFEQLTKKT